jgi:hypothetical protein
MCIILKAFFARQWKLWLCARVTVLTLYYVAYFVHISFRK